MLPKLRPYLFLLLFMEEISSGLLLFQLGRRYLCHGAWPRAENEISTNIHPHPCQMSFSSFLSELRENKQGEVILLHRTTRGETLKKGVLCFVSLFFCVWRRVESFQCQKWGKKFYTGDSGGQTGLDLCFGQKLPVPGFSQSLRVLTQGGFLLGALCRRSAPAQIEQSAEVWWNLI